MEKILLITPPFTQLNTPYPATAYLKGFLNTKNIQTYQIDLGIEVILELFSKNGLQNIFNQISNSDKLSENNNRIFALKNNYIQTIDAVILFLQGKNNNFARLICARTLLPEANRFNQLFDLDFAFGNMGLQDKAKHLATLYLEDISDFIIENIDENFGFTRYAERLGRSANSFNELYKSLQNEPSYIDSISLTILEKKIKDINPKLICFSVPFPGNLYSAFKCAQFIKNNYPNIKTEMGGGFPNTELRSLTEIKVFEFFDFILLDDGELPLELVINAIENPNENPTFKRTFLVENNKVIYKNNSTLPDYKQTQVGTPDYSDLFLDKYISVIEVVNPMHSLWSDGRWNKLTMAHGCYWGKCTFCDISLDYIKVYEPVLATVLVDRMEQLIEQTGENGFHFVDEAAPPALMREVALEILRRNLIVTWWTNIRFEKSFTKSLCQLLVKSGCIAISGGLEVASDRLLEVIKKGVTVKQVAKVTQNFSETGIMVHAYLMYGYPTQTIQETIDSLEMVRQLFENGCIQSGFWHQFALTAHSPVGLNPEEFGIIPKVNKISFAHNDIDFVDKTGVNHEIFSFGLKKSLYNYMHGLCLNDNLQNWFETKIPKTTIKPNFIENCLIDENLLKLNANQKIVYLGNLPNVLNFEKKGFALTKLTFFETSGNYSISIEFDKASWLLLILEKTSFNKTKTTTIQEIKTDFELQFDDFELFWFSKPIEKLKENGLLVL